jgi:ribonuclease VapC
MVIDTSAVIAILLGESTASGLIDAVDDSPVVLLSAAALVESGIVTLRRLGDDGEGHLERILHRLGAKVVPVSREQAEIARSAFRRFGKGRHPAGLNFGDCFSYALARALDEPLLFVGDDFSRTDVGIARY